MDACRRNGEILIRKMAVGTLVDETFSFSRKCLEQQQVSPIW
jgi:hypothetical protein